MAEIKGPLSETVAAVSETVTTPAAGPGRPVVALGAVARLAALAVAFGETMATDMFLAEGEEEEEEPPPEEIEEDRPQHERPRRRAPLEGHCQGTVCARDPSGSCQCHCGRCKRSQ